MTRRSSLAIAIAIAIVSLGCSSTRPRQPEPNACVAASDCAPGPFVDPENVCCDSGLDLGVFSRAYLDWRARIRASECAKATCPPQPSPALPPPCATEPRCVAGRCTGSCEGR